MVNQNASTISTTQSDNVVYATTTAATYAGGRISGSVTFAAPATSGFLSWVLVKVPNAIAASTISVTDGGVTYNPEQDVLAAGTIPYIAGLNYDPIPIDVLVKTKRKMLTGDQILFCYHSSTNVACYLSTIHTAFIKE